MSEPKWLFIVTIERDSKGNMANFYIVAPNRDAAEVEACKLAGVKEDTEPHTSQRMNRIDSVV